MAGLLWFVPLALSLWVIVTPFLPAGFERQIVSGAPSAEFDPGRILITPIFPHLDRMPFGIGEFLVSPAMSVPLLLVAIVVVVAVGVRLHRDRVLLVAWLFAVVVLCARALLSSLVSERHLGSRSPCSCCAGSTRRIEIAP